MVVPIHILAILILLGLPTILRIFQAVDAELAPYGLRLIGSGER